MTRILARYFSAVILKHYVLFSIAAVVIASLVEFLENRDGLLDDPSVSMLDALKYSALSAPAIFSLLAGFIALVSALIAAMTLLRYSELKAMLAAGLGHGQLLLALAPAALSMLAFHFLMDSAVLPRTAAELRAWGVGKAWTRQPGDTEAIWTRDGDYIVAVRGLDARAGALVGVEVFALGTSGDLKWHLSAPVARLDAGYLVIPRATRTVAGGARTSTVSDVRFRSRLDFDTLALLAPQPHQMSAWTIARLLKQSGAASRPRHVYDLWFHRRLAAPVTTALAVLLLAPMIERLHRISTVPIVLVGLAGGFCYFVADGLLTGLGEAGLVRPAIAAWALPCLLGLLILAMSRDGPRPIAGL